MTANCLNKGMFNPKLKFCTFLRTANAFGHGDGDAATTTSHPLGSSNLALDQRAIRVLFQLSS